MMRLRPITARSVLRRRPLSLLALLLLIAACAAPSAVEVTPSPEAPQRLRLATTTSTADTGLLDAILPDFERRYSAQVEVIAVGTGQAIALGERGDVDVLLVHARAREDAFVAAGHGLARRDVMYNDFVVVGPAEDQAGVARAASAPEAFAAIAAAAAPFASRGDDSGTHTRELSIWASAGITPTQALDWYRSLGQGMGETLLAADELGAYTLADRGTFLSTQARLPGLRVLLGGANLAENDDPALRNTYGVIPLSAEKHPGVNAALAEQFADWITSPAVQEAIGAFGQERYGQPLFYPSAGANG